MLSCKKIEMHFFFFFWFWILSFIRTRCTIWACRYIIPLIVLIWHCLVLRYALIYKPRKKNEKWREQKKKNPKPNTKKKHWEITSSGRSRLTLLPFVCRLWRCHVICNPFSNQMRSINCLIEYQRINCKRFHYKLYFKWHDFYLF